jgi:hypothetical protein
MLFVMMARIFATVLVLGSALLAGCGSRALQAPPKPPPPAQPRTEVDRHPNRDEPPKLIAPPPAYGNKVVLAQRHTRSHLY